MMLLNHDGHVWNSSGHEAVDLFEAQDNIRKCRQRRPLIQLMIVVAL